MQCRNHPEREGVFQCVECGESFCAKCVKKISGEYYCISCKYRASAKREVDRKHTRDVMLETAGATGYAGFWHRFGATILDGLLLNIVGLVLWAA